MDLQDVIWCDKPVGEISVERSGLYHLVKCRCQLPYGPIYRLCAVSDGRDVDLGILVPQNGNFQLIKRLPIKLLGEGPFSFRVTDNSTKREEDFIPIDPIKPFECLSRISSGRFVKNNNISGIILQEQ